MTEIAMALANVPPISYSENPAMLDAKVVAIIGKYFLP